MSAVPQNMAALEKANEFRVAQARVKKELRAHMLALRDAMDRECCEKMELHTLLGALPRVGPMKIAKILRGAQDDGVFASQGRRVGCLTDREKQALCASAARRCPASVLGEAS